MPTSPDASTPPFGPGIHRVDEFRALRATIRERGTLRIRLAAGGLAVWAALHLGVQVWLPAPVTYLVPLLVLAGMFEAVFSLHVGVERIGRYLEAAYEADSTDGPRWERTAHAFGSADRSVTDSAGRLDPLLSAPYVGAILLNLVPVVLLTVGTGSSDIGPMVELGLYGGLHLALIARVERARRFAARQRGQELERFAQLIKPD